MKGGVLLEARARYGVDECLPAHPAHEQYAASRRWLACAREALRWSRQAPQAQSAWLAKTCDALVRAAEHRDAARRWRKGLEKTMRTEGIEETVAESERETDPETRVIEERVREAVRSRSAIVAYYAAARRALALARVYRDEHGTTGRREDDVLQEIRRYRGAIRALRGSAPVESSRPGLHKVATAQDLARKTGTGS